jgi:hypothetical protein
MTSTNFQVMENGHLIATLNQESVMSFLCTLSEFGYGFSRFMAMTLVA